jgi:hypothetical protein
MGKLSVATVQQGKWSVNDYLDEGRAIIGFGDMLLDVWRFRDD